MSIFVDTKALEIVKAEMYRHGSRVTDTATGMKMCCPIHNENTPSCNVNLSAPNVPIGWVHCWGCGYSNPWNVMAKQLKWQTLPNGSSKEVARIAPNAGIRLQRLKRDMMEDTTEEPEWETIEPALRGRPMDTIELEWRSLKPKFLNKLGYKRFLARDGEPFIAIPVYVHKQMVGLIRGRWAKKEGQDSYLNAPGKWAKQQGLLGFDYMQTLKMWKEYRFVIVVEGPRDALVLLQAGIPAVSILGSNNWSLFKLEYLIDLNPALIVTLMDNDKAGRKVARLINKDCKKRHAPCLVIQLPKKEKIGRKLDPAMLKPKQRAQVIAHIQKHL